MTDKPGLAGLADRMANIYDPEDGDYARVNHLSGAPHVASPSPPQERSSARPNRDFADELLEVARAGLQQQADLRRELERQLQATRDGEAVKRLRAQIEATRQNGRENNGNRLRELGREYFERTGAGGKAV